MPKLRYPVFILLAGVTVFLCRAVQAAQLESIAFRTETAVQKFEKLRQSAVVLNFVQPTRGLISRLRLAFGALERGADSRFFVSFGPVWRLRNLFVARRGFVEVGTSPTYIDGSTFDGEDLGGNFHFTTAVRIGADFGRRRQTLLALRIQHISNGGVNETNPGTDMVGLEVEYRFGHSRHAR